MNRQRKDTHSDSIPFLVVEEETLKTEEEILQGWPKHFGNLSTPKDKPGYDSSYYDHITADVALLELLTMNPVLDTECISNDEVAMAIGKLNSGKAADKEGISAEHLKHAGPAIIPYLTALFNNVISKGYIPLPFKEGTITPILKKGKEKTNPSNYRGITINSIIGKTLEIICLNRLLPTLRAHQSPYQRGFTQGVSAMNASILLLETIHEYKDNQKNIGVDRCPTPQTVLHEYTKRAMVHHRGLV